MAGGGAGVATGAGTRVDVTLKLPQLQNLCKRDPDGYREDYDAQTRRLESELGILSLQPNTEPSPRLVELIQFAAAVSSSSYKGEESDRIADMLMNLLMGTSPSSASSSSSSSKRGQSVEHISTMPSAALQLHREVRKTCVSALILMRNKGAVEPLRLLELFFRIMAVVPDKALRELLYKHIVNDIRNINKKGKRDEKVNRSVQAFLHRVVSSHGSPAGSASDSHGGRDEDTATDIAAKRATDMVCELYRRHVWTDDRTVAILASAVESSNTTVASRAMRFFLGIEEKMASDARMQEESEWESNNSVDYHLHSKKTASRARHVARQIKSRKKAQQKKENGDWMEASVDKDRGVEASKKLYPAIELLRDAQGLAETVFRRLRSAGSYKYETKLLMMNFVTRLVGNHELMLLPLYPFLQKYMGGHQRDVTAVLAYTVQACHEHVPPDEIYGILKTVAHNFITERCSEEQMAVGINAARAICARVPAALSVEESNQSEGSTAMDIEAFARDLAAYSKHRDRSVSIAGKTWTNFVREVYPLLLKGKDRGLKGSALHKAGVKPLRYGERKVASGVEGADLLVEYEAKKAAAKSRSEKNGDGEDEEKSDGGSDSWEEVGDAGSEGSDSGSGGWEDVQAGEEDGDRQIAVEDDDSDGEAPTLVNLDKKAGGDDVKDSSLDVSKMTVQERDKLKQRVSSTRVFTSGDFEKMRKLLEREQRAKRDPREAARRKRAIARGEEFEELSGDDSDESDDSDSDEIHIAGAVRPEELMAEARRKRQSKAEKLEKIIAGRTKFESKVRTGGTTDNEKKRKKNFLMSKYSREARAKGRTKGKKRKVKALGHEAKKRRRKV